MTSSGKPQHSAGTPSAPANLALDSQSVCNEVDALLIAHPESRNVLRHLAYFAASLSKSGTAAIESTRLDVLKQALEQLLLVASDEPSTNLQLLAQRMGESIARREGPARPLMQANNQLADLMDGQKMVVSEGRMSDFVRLAGASAQHDDPAS